MAEEITYDQIETGDPDPLGLRRQLKQAKKPAQSVDPLGLRSQLRGTTAPQQPAFQIKIEDPAYGRPIEPKYESTWVKGDTYLSESGITAPKEFSFDKPYDPLAVEKLKGKATEAHKKIQQELHGNDEMYAQKAREYRRDSYTVENLREDYRKKGIMLAPQDEKEALKRAKVERYLDTVTAEDIADIKAGTILDNTNARRFVSALNKPELAKNAYLVDKYNELAADPNGNHRVEKIKNIADLIGKKHIIYDAENRVAIEPLGLIGSVVEGVKNKFKNEEEHDFFKNASDATIINELESQRNNPDIDEPLKVPKGWVNKQMMSLSEMPITPIVAGVAATIGGTFIGNPELGTIAATALGAYENRKINYTQAFKQVYNEVRDQGGSEFDAITKARKFSNYAQEIGTIVGAAQGAIGANIAAVPLRFSVPYQRSIGQMLKQAGSDLGKVLIDGATQGGLAAFGEAAKNKAVQALGVKRDIDSGVSDAFWSNLLMTVGIGAAMKAGRGLTKENYKTILHGLSKVPEENINAALQEQVKSGAVTQEAASQALGRINEYKGLDKLIPENVSEEARFKIQDNILKRKELEEKLESTDKAYHPAIKEKIKAIDEEIIGLSKDTVKPEKVESGLSKSQEKEAIETAEEFLAEGILPNTYESMIKQDPVGFWKMIAQQAQNRDENWKPLTQELPEQAVRDQFGDTVVEYAKELFPAPETAEPSSLVSVIQPEEIKRPETITIKPKENAVSERSATTPIVDEAPGSGPEVVAGVPEPWEAAIPQEGQRPLQEENITPGQEGQVGEPPLVGITHKQMDALSAEWGLPEYKGSPEKVSEWDQQAAVRLQQPEALNNLFNKLRNGELPDPVETRMMVQYWGDLMAKLDRNPYDRALQHQALRTKDIFNISGRIWGKAGAARKGLKPAEETMGDFLIRDREANKAPLTDEQITISKKEYEDIKAAKEAYEQKIAKDKEAQLVQKAEKVVAEEAKKTKKQSGKDYSAERKQIIDDLKKKWDSSKGQLSSTFIPYADRLVKIAPDVVKLMKSYVEQGITELPDVVKAIHRTIKDHLDGITEKNVHDIIAGEYNEKKPTRNQLAQQLYDLRKEAKLINELEQLQNGNVPADSKKQIKRNQKIEALRQQIKELRDEMGLNDKTDADKLSALKSRYKKQISDLEKKIEKGDYGPDEKPTPLKLDKESQELRDKYLELKREREIRLAKQEYENRSTFQKVKDVGIKVLNTPRELMASFDFSAPLRQGIVATVSHPSKAINIQKGGKLGYKLGGAFPEMFRQAFSKGEFTRWLGELKESTDYPIMEEAGLYVADPENLNISAKEEQFMGSMVDHVPLLKKTLGVPVKASERAYVSYLNKMRVDIFRQGKDFFESQGRTIENSPELYKGLANYINNSTGRGGLGPLNNAAPILNTTFFSPRLIASRINLLNPIYYTKLPKEVRIMALKDMGKMILFGGTLLGLAKMSGADVEKDPRSSDFGKIKVGNTRWDVWGGFQQYIRLLSQVITGKTKSTQSGEIRDLRADAFPYKSRVDQIASFFRGKLAPVPGTAVDILAGRNMMGEEFDPTNKAYELFTPMIIQDVREAWKDRGFSSLFTVGVPSAFGVGVSTYAPTKQPTPDSDENKPNHTLRNKSTKKIKRI